MGQNVKASRQKSLGLLQPLNITTWNEENIAMDFIVCLPKTLKGYALIWVLIDKLTKSTYFLSSKATYTTDNWVELYMRKIVRQYGVSISIVSDRDPYFTSAFLCNL